MLKVPYTSQGYIDIEAVRSLTASTPFVFIIGSRQCGKTYGVTRSILDHQELPVIIRRTKEERLKFANDQVTPLRPIDRSILGVASGDIVQLFHRDPEAEDGRGAGAGWVLDLNTARKRGFSMPPFSSVLYDEAVPEQHAGGRSDRAQAETFFNLLITLFANDPKFMSSGAEHPKVWILANSNSIDAAIFSVFGITDTIEMMLRTGREVYVSPQRALAIFLAQAPERAAVREEMPLMRVARASDQRDMALHNRFMGDTMGVRGWPLRAFKALASFSGEYDSFTVWLHKDCRRPWIYVTRGAYPARHMLPNTQEAFTQLGKATAFKSRLEFWYLVLHANAGVNAFFDSLNAKQWFTSMRKG